MGSALHNQGTATLGRPAAVEIHTTTVTATTTATATATVTVTATATEDAVASLEHQNSTNLMNSLKSAMLWTSVGAMVAPVVVVVDSPEHQNPTM